MYLDLNTHLPAKFLSFFETVLSILKRLHQFTAPVSLTLFCQCRTNPERGKQADVQRPSSRLLFS